MRKIQNNENLFVNGLKNIAASKLEDDEELLKIWWTKKYDLPSNHPLLLERHLEDLAIEYHMDSIIDKKQQNTSELPEELANDVGWEDDIPEEHDNKIKKLLKKAPKVDLKMFKKKSKDLEIDETF